MTKSKYKDFYRWIDNLKYGFTYGYIRNYKGFLRFTLYKNEFQFNLSNFTINDLKNQILEILKNENKHYKK